MNKFILCKYLWGKAMSEIYIFEAPFKKKGMNSLGKQENNVIALPFIDKDTVVKTMVMLRTLPDQKVLDPFNRRQP